LYSGPQREGFERRRQLSTKTMSTFDYYQPPADEIFDDIKVNAIMIWESYDDRYGYASGKVHRIKDFENIRDNAWTIVAMFDHINQARLLYLVSTETRRAITEMLTWSAEQK